MSGRESSDLTGRGSDFGVNASTWGPAIGRRFTGLGRALIAHRRTLVESQLSEGVQGRVNRVRQSPHQERPTTGSGEA